MAQISASRKEAFRILLAVERGEAHSDDLLRGNSVSKLSAGDRNLTTALVLGVLRWQLALDAQFRPLLKKPNAKLDTEVQIALRLGAFQLLHMDRIPAHAAIDESVELAKQAGHRFASGMINAILRKLAASASSAAPEPELIPPRQVTTSALAAYPQWMRDRWSQFFGEETACAVCRHGQFPPLLALRIANADVESELEREGVKLAPGELLTTARLVIAGDVTATAVFHQGRVRIQDEASQLVAEIAGQGSKVLDCCAAPGGKTLVLAERNPHARITACEASPQRLESLRHRVAPLGDRIECRLADATALPFDAAFDLVLADVPCSGTGTLGRNPEIRHRLQPDDLPRQAERQGAIFVSVIRAAGPGASIVYSTCSLEPEENEQVVEAVLHNGAPARILPMGPRLDHMHRNGILAAGALEKLQQAVTSKGFLRLMPGAFGTDGFFVALLEKVP